MFLTINEAKKLIESGKLLHIAGDETLLSQLPKGNWLGGTTPYFIANSGGIMQKQTVFVNELEGAEEFRFAQYDAESLKSITDDAYDNGVTFLILPFASEVATVYAKSAPYMEDLLMKPVVGWISGFDLDAGGCAKAYDGTAAAGWSDKAVAVHIKLPADRLASVGIVNIFQADSASPVIEFPSDELEVTTCKVNGEEVNLAAYLTKHNINTQLPLVADYNGVYINVSIKAVDSEKGVVSLYAPVLAGEEYRFAVDVGNYMDAFAPKLTGMEEKKPVFSCNCILNYLYGDLAGKATPPFEGPVTFGEIAYQLLNQTLVYVEY